MASEIEILGNEYVLITKAEYDSFVDDTNWLMCLQAAGVDNWSGYGHAMELMGEEDEG